MRNNELTELSAFIAVAKHRSFQRAAVERAVTPSAMSHAVRSLETRLGVRLLHRTTRSVSLTAAGEGLYARLQPAFGDIKDALDGVNTHRDTPIGKVRLNVPRSVAPFFVPAIAKLLAKNPGLHVELAIDDRLVDIASAGFDAGIRYGERVAQDMVAVRIKPSVRFAVVGSPAYFEKRSPPRTPHDLKDHDCIRYNFPSGKPFHWEFERGSESLDVEVAGPMTVDDQEIMVDAALQGIGLAYVFEGRVVEHVREGRLVQCLKTWCPPMDELFLYYPNRRHVPAGLRALIELIKVR